jgi:hypothetical protein
MTGDINLSPSASCLVMTTEILRNMLYRGATEMQEVAWVIFDEIHYMRDRERGVVWEEAIILMVRAPALSFHIPNPLVVISAEPHSSRVSLCDIIQRRSVRCLDYPYAFRSMSCRANRWVIVLPCYLPLPVLSLTQKNARPLYIIMRT